MDAGPPEGVRRGAEGGGSQASGKPSARFTRLFDSETSSNRASHRFRCTCDSSSQSVSEQYALRTVSSILGCPQSRGFGHQSIGPRFRQKWKDPSIRQRLCFNATPCRPPATFQTLTPETCAETLGALSFQKGMSKLRRAATLGFETNIFDTSCCELARAGCMPFLAHF